MKQNLSSWFRCAIALFLISPMGSNVVAEEICGLSNVSYNMAFADGFETFPPAQVVNRAGASESKRTGPVNVGKPTMLAPKIQMGVAPTVSITSPTEGATLPSRRVQVRGTYTGPSNTGIAINGAPAFAQNGNFISAVLTLPAGATAIEVKATTFDNLTATATRNVSAANSLPLVELVSSQPAQFSGKKLSFSLGNPTGLTIDQVAIDFNGDNVDEYSGPVANAPKSFTYAVPGIFRTRISATTSDPNGSYSEDRYVAVLDLAQQRQLVCAVYGAFRDALANNDLNATLGVFPANRREVLTPFFTALGDNKPVFAGRLGTLAQGTIGFDTAEVTALSIEAGEPIGYSVRFARDANGVWRLDDF